MTAEQRKLLEQFVAGETDDTGWAVNDAVTAALKDLDARTPDPAADESDIALIGVMRAMRDHELPPRKKAKDMTREELLIECDRLRNICWDRRGAIQDLQAELQAARTPDPARLLAAAKDAVQEYRHDGTCISELEKAIAEFEAAAKGGA